MGKDNILTQQEINELLGIVANESELAPQDKLDENKNKNSQKKVFIYDFKRPARFSKDQIQTLTQIHEEFARVISFEFSRWFRLGVSFQLVSVDQLLYEELICSMPNPCTAALLRSDSDHLFMTEFSNSILSAMIDRLFGGQGVPLPASRPLPEIEQRVFQIILDRCLSSFNQSWESFFPIQAKLDKIKTSPADLSLTEKERQVLAFVFEVKIGECEGLITLSYPENFFSSMKEAWEDSKKKLTHSRPSHDYEISLPIKNFTLKDFESLQIGQKIPVSLSSLIYLTDLETPLLAYQISEISEKSLCILPSEDNKIQIAKPEEDETKFNFLFSEIKNLHRKIARLKEKIENNPNPSHFSSPEYWAQIIEKIQLPFFSHWVATGHPQITAFILSRFQSEKAASFLNALPLEQKPDILRRIACLDAVGQEIEQLLGSFLEEKKDSSDFSLTFSGGIKKAAEILKQSDSSTEKQILESLSEIDFELTQAIEQSLFVFENILSLEDRSIQRVLREIEHTDLLKALKGASSLIQEKFLKNMSKKAQIIFQEDLEALGPIRLTEAEEAQKKILGSIKSLFDCGEII